jgi:hypothetical protein
MGFYVRKSFKIGPVRLNLSKGGLGLSGGVTGARLGISSQGRTYVHGGRGGLYARKYFGATRRATTTRITTVSDTATIHEKTGATYETEPVALGPAPLRERLMRKPSPVARYHWLPVGATILMVVAAAIEAGSGARVIPFTTAAAMVFAWIILVGRARRRNRAGEKLGGLLLTCSGAGQPLGEEQRRRLERALQDPRVTPDDRRYQCEVAYLTALQKVVDDRTITKDELEFLTSLGRLIGLPDAFYAEARLEVFRESYLEAVADHDLTESEETVLEQMRSALAIPETVIEAELDMIQRLKELREIRSGNLPELKPSTNLQKSETCHFEDQGRILKERTLRSFQTAGHRYRVRSLAVDKEGTLFITNRRILLVHDGTTSIRLDRILDVDVDCDQNLLTIVKDGARTPTYITTPDSLRAGAVLAAVARL